MNNLIVASACQDRLSLWKSGLAQFVSAPLIIEKLILNQYESLINDVLEIKPATLLLDIDVLAMNGFLDIAGLRALSAEVNTIILSGEISEELEWELLKAGIRGCCHNDIEPKFMKQIVMAVQQGELWIRRSLTSRLIDELSKTTSKNKAYRATLGLLNKLTQREYDIAIRVGNGETNKQIAQSCAITERTVKAHLTEIFHKLGVSDRLNLALLLVADNRVACENAASVFDGQSHNSQAGSIKNKAIQLFHS